jgi:hypothetical protein
MGRLRRGIQDQRRPRVPVEVERQREIPEERQGLARDRARVETPVGRRIQALTVQEPILDQLQVRVERKRLVIDEPARAYGLTRSPGTRSPYPFSSASGGTTWS